MELLRGEVYRMGPIGPKHVHKVAQLDARLQEALKGKAVVAVQSPLRLSEDSEPEPDLMVLKPPLERYQDRLPTPEDVLLLVEVADTSLEFDREVKLPLYAEAGIPEVWIVNLPEEALESYAFPHHLPERHPKGEEVAPKAFPGKKLPWWV